jgi:hypothetical protein
MKRAEVQPNLAPLDQFRMYAAPQKQSSARVSEIVPTNREDPASDAVRTSEFAWSVIQDLYLERVQEARRAKKGSQLTHKDSGQKSGWIILKRPDPEHRVSRITPK